MSHILALDQGTSSSRSIVFDAQGRIVAMAQREFRQIFPQPGWVEHDPEEIWASQLATAQEALAQADLKAGDIKGIGITNQRETTLLWNRRTGQPVHNAIVWQDRRTEPLCAQLREKGLEPMIERATGLRIYTRLQAHFTPTTPAQRVGNFTGQLAQQLGFTDSGILLTYFADIDRWGLWVGEQQLPRLMGRPGTVKEFMQDSALHHAKQALLAEAMAQADIFFEELAGIRPIAEGDKLKCQTDALLDAVIMKFEPVR